MARGLSSTEVGIIIATSPLFMFIFSPITGYLLRRGISERFILIGGSVECALVSSLRPVLFLFVVLESLMSV